MRVANFTKFFIELCATSPRLAVVCLALVELLLGAGIFAYICKGVVSGSIIAFYAVFAGSVVGLCISAVRHVKR